MALPAPVYILSGGRTKFQLVMSFWFGTFERASRFPLHRALGAVGTSFSAPESLRDG